MFLVGRTLCGLACGIVFSNTPVYMSEVSPPHTRGMLVGLQGVCIVTAYIISSSAALGFHFVTSEIQWRLNFIILTALSFGLLVSLLFLPESPRWLVEHHRNAEAAVILERLHRTKNDPGALVARAEMIQITAQVELERSLPTGFIYILKTPHLRRRAICTLLTWSMGQSDGINVITNLAPELFAGLGYDTVLQLTLGLIYTVCLWIGCAFNILLLDRVGRVKLFGKNALDRTLMRAKSSAHLFVQLREDLAAPSC
jgi:MFS family permease